MPSYPHLTGLILAGGRGRRLGGQNKAFLELDGRPFIHRLVQLFSRLFGQVIIVTNQPSAFASLSVRIVQDLELNMGAIMGLLTGLFYAPSEWSFVSACDTPLLKEKLVIRVVEAIDQGVRVVLPRTPDGLQPLTAAYHRACLPILQRLVAQGERSIRPLYKKVRVRYLEPAVLEEVDPEGLSFINVNTLADVDGLQRLEGDE